MDAQAKRSVFLLVCMAMLLCCRSVAQLSPPDSSVLSPSIASPAQTATHAALQIANQTPYTVIALVYAETGPLTHRMDGWYTLKPGEIRTLGYDFEGAPNYQIYAETRSPDAVRLIHKRGKGKLSPILYFDGSGDAAHLIDYSGSDGVELLKALFALPAQTKNVSFATVPTTPSETTTTYRFTDNALPGVFDTSGLPVREDEQLRIISARARDLARSLARQVRTQAAYPGFRNVPYLLGVDIKDPNGRGEIGVTVGRAVSKTIFGDPSLFQRGDIITGLSGKYGEIEPVYAHEDIVELLHDHATDPRKGINVPIKVRLIRGNNQITAQTTYFFNLACTSCWPPGELTNFKAFTTAAFNAWFLGGGAWVTTVATRLYYLLTTGTFGDLESDHFLEVQKIARLRQFAPRLTKMGEFIPIYGLVLVSAPRLLFDRLLARTVTLSGSTAFVTSIAVDTVENSAWLVFGGSPLISKDYIRAEVKRSVPSNIEMSVGMRAVYGVLGHNTPIKIPQGRMRTYAE